jgi:hypothetical protein
MYPQYTGYGQPQYQGQQQQQPQQPQYGAPQPQYLAAQPTGYVQSHPTGFLQPQATGFLQPLHGQPTGYQPQQRFANAPPMPSPISRGPSMQMQVSPMSTGYQPQQASLQPPQQQFQQPPQQQPPQQYQPQFLPSVPQMFTQTFLPAQPTYAAMAPSQMQFSQPSMLNGQSLQQVYQQQNVQQHGQAQVNVPWQLSADERKNYDSIFRAWDPQGTGFISGKLVRPRAGDLFDDNGLQAPCRRRCSDRVALSATS